MSEIKFACPFCQQHIACDAGYFGLRIDCPGCGGTITVPRLTSAGAAPSGALLVASTPTPAPNPGARVPGGDFWTEEEWDRHAAQVSPLVEPLGLVITTLTFLPIPAAWLFFGWIEHARSAYRIWVSFSILCSLAAAWLIVGKNIGAVLPRALVAVPLAAGIFLVQFSIGTCVGCCAAGGEL